MAEYDAIKHAYQTLNGQVDDFLGGMDPKDAAKKILELHRSFLGIGANNDPKLRGFSLQYMNAVHEAVQKYNNGKKLISGADLFKALNGALQPILGASKEAAAEKGISLSDADEVQALAPKVLEKIVNESH